GRRGNSEGLNLPALGIELDSSGRIVTNSSRQAGNSGIYAAGDIVASPSLVYVAAIEGKIAAKSALNAGNNAWKETISLDIVPEVIFTTPQVAKVGLTEAEAGARGINVEKSAFPYSETPNAGVNEVTAGVIVLIRDAESHKLLGGDIVAPNAGDMIQTLTIAIEAGWTTERLQDVLFPYLTGVEGLKLASITFAKDVSKLSCCAV
ncbi:MAG: mercuric reductase, partial [Spirochaetes bacterium]